MGSVIDINISYQLAFVTPGSSPFSASSLNVILDNPNFLINPLGLPDTAHLFVNLEALEDLGSFCIFIIAFSFSSSETLGFIIISLI